MKRFIIFLTAILFVGGAFSGCSTMKYVNRARTSFEQAKASDAEIKAPFEFYASEAYLGLADHEYEEGDKSQAKIFAEESEKYSTEALEIIRGGVR